MNKHIKAFEDTLTGHIVPAMVEIEIDAWMECECCTQLTGNIYTLHEISFHDGDIIDTIKVCMSCWDYFINPESSDIEINENEEADNIDPSINQDERKALNGAFNAINNGKQEYSKDDIVDMKLAWAINRVANRTWTITEDKGFHDLPGFESDISETTRALLMIVDEVMEATQELRNGSTPDKIIGELADVVLRALDLAYSLDMDCQYESIGEAIINKMAKNASRANRHGGKLL